MKNLKKAFTLILVSLTLAGTATAAAAFENNPVMEETAAEEILSSGECGDNLTWSLYDDGELVIEGEGNMWDWDYQNNAPWYDHFENIRKVTIQNGVTTVGDHAFRNCRNATSASIPNTVTVIGIDAFSNTSLTDVTIPNSVTKICRYAFDGCHNLKSVFIPKTVTEIGWGVFARCHSLVSITVDKANPAYTNDESGVLFTKDQTMLLQYPTGKTDSSYTIPNGVTTIDLHAFEDSLLVSVSLPDTVTYIDANAFYDCPNLTEITIPKKITRLGYGALACCPSLEKATVLSRDVFFNPEVFLNAADSFVLCGYAGSTAEAYAAEKGLTFEALDEPAPEETAVPEETVPPTEVPALPGDITGDESLDIRDAIALFRYSMMPDLYPVTYSGSMDFNKDGSVDITDVITLFRHSMMPDLYPLEEEGVYADFFKGLVQKFFFESYINGLRYFSSPADLPFARIFELTHTYAKTYGVDLTEYREYHAEYDWLYVDRIPADVFDTLTERMWGMTFSYTDSPYYDAETNTLVYETIGGLGGFPTTMEFDSYTVSGNEFTVYIKCWNTTTQKPQTGVEGVDWYYEFFMGEDLYYVFAGFDQIKAALVDGYIQIQSYTN